MKLIKYILIILIVNGSLIAQETLTLEKAVNLALNKNPGIQISKKNAEISQNNFSLGNAGLLPKIDLSADISHTDLNNKTTAGTVKDISTITSAGITASYTLFNGMANFNNYYRLEKLGKVGEIQNKLYIENTIYSVIQSYYNLALLKENLNVAKEALEISQQRFDRVFNQNKYGSANKIQVLNAQVDLSSDSVSYFNAQLSYDQGIRNLKVLLNYKEDFNVDPSVIFEINPDYNQLHKWAMESNSEILLAKENVNIADLDKSIAGAGFMPTLDLTASYGYNQRDENWKIGLDDPNSSFSAKLTLRYNLFNGMRTKIKKENSVISYENKKSDLEDTENKIERDLANAFNSYKNNLFILDVQKRNLITAETNFKRTTS